MIANITMTAAAIDAAGQGESRPGRSASAPVRHSDWGMDVLLPARGDEAAATEPPFSAAPRRG